jgi:hypothetical protein
MKRALITGITGQDGAYLAEYLGLGAQDQLRGAGHRDGHGRFEGSGKRHHGASEGLPDLRQFGITIFATDTHRPTQTGDFFLDSVVQRKEELSSMFVRAGL